MTTPEHRFPRSASMLIPILALFVACFEAPPRSEVETPDDPSGEAVAAVAPARYLTHFAFAGLDGTVLFASFEQSTDEQTLTRAYDAWWSGDEGWRSLASVRDTLPVPRAAWRVLPASGIDVRVGDAREVVGLGFSTPEGRVELHAGDEVAVWSGPTGQRESMSVAGLDSGEDAVGGLLFFRRAARALQFPDAPGASRGFLMTDSIGNGLLIESNEEDGSAVAHTWMHGSVEAWSDVSLIADSVGNAGQSRRWRFEIPEAALSGTIQAVSSPTADPVPAFRVECTLIADGDMFRFVGLSAPLPLP